MEFRKGLLKAASLLALTAASQNPASAAVSPVDSPDTVKAAVSSGAQIDPLFELMSRTNGSFSGDSVEKALAAMFSAPAPGQVESIPGLLTGLAGLGAPSDVLARAKQMLIGVVSSVASIDEDLRESVLTQMEMGPSSFKLAQRPKKKRDPDEVGQVPPAAQS